MRNRQLQHYRRTDLKSGFLTLATQMDANFTALQNAQGTGDQTTIDQATADINATVDAMKALATRDTLAVTPTPETAA